MIRAELLARVSELRESRQAFVLATVVRVAKPASAHAGDSAILLSDGTMEGFVGGMCSESTVRTHGLRQLAAGRSVLLHIMPEGRDSMAQEDELTVGNPCLSGGALDIFLEVMRPPALVHLYGDTPVARALQAVGAAAGLDVRATTDAAVPVPPDATAVVVASQGGDEHRVITAACDAGVPYIGLLASRRRGSALLDALGLDAEQRDRVHTPAGLDIGAQSPGEIAVSILAEVIALGRTHGPFIRSESGTVTQPAADLGLVEAIDPICGMSVAVTETAIRAETQDGTVYFCCPGCRDAFLAGTAG